MADHSDCWLDTESIGLIRLNNADFYDDMIETVEVYFSRDAIG